MKKLLFLFLVTLNSIGFSQSLSSPESVEWDQANNRWLVGNSGNGTILARSVTGVLSNFASGLPSGPYGIEIIGDKVYACSGGFIRGYNLTNGANVFNLNVGGTFLKGLTSDGVNFLYATDFTAKKIFKIDVAATSFTTIATGLVKTPNGILCEPELNRCLIVNWGANAPILAINLTTNAITTVLATTLGNCDGITKDSCGNYYVSAWSNNKLNKFNPELTGTFTVIPGTLSSPADIDCRFGTTSDTIGIPGGGVLSFPEIVRPNPIITNTSNTLSTTTTFEAYQWFYNGVAISDANSQTLPALGLGVYCCQITYATCSIVSNCIEITSLANDTFLNQNEGLKLYPNPSNKKIVIEFPFAQKMSYKVFDILGKKVIEGENSNATNTTIDIDNLKAGSYFVKITLDGVEKTNSFLKE
jgi:Secretion system C-terminal sorting domain